MLAVVLALAAILVSLALPMLFSKRLDVKGKFCYIPGGSAGLGKALAAELVRRGAHVVIVARDAKRSSETIAELRRLGTDDQVIATVSADLTQHENAADALKEACGHFGGRAPDYTFLCAGFSKPQLFVTTTPEDLKWGLDGVYWVSAWTAHAATQLMVKQRRKGTIVFVSSFLGYTAFAGYSGYSPAKYAVRGLADCLRSELALYDIKVHVYMPAGILSPGYENEQLTKPDVTKKIEEGDKPITAEAAASCLIKGLEAGHYAITNDLVTDLIRVGASGPVPGNGILDWGYWIIGALGTPIWRMLTDRTVRRHSPVAWKDLEERNFFDN